jgi:adenine-specific DNA-methyltransferase
MATINSTFEELRVYYDSVLNTDKTTYKSSNDEPTPIMCASEMVDKIPVELWTRKELAILDPCCGNGNLFIPVLFKLLAAGHNKSNILNNILEFNDINEQRLDNVRTVFCAHEYNLRISSNDFLTTVDPGRRYDLIVANPPYAKLMDDGKRASKNHNLIKDFIEQSLKLLKPGGYLMFITPDNWMSFADRNQLIEIITSLQIIHLNIHGAKRFFKKIGSSFTWYIVQNCQYYKDMTVSGVWKKKTYESSVVSQPRRYIPLLYNQLVNNILAKTVDNAAIPKFAVQTSSDLHRYTKATLISNEETDQYKYRLIHTPKQTAFASRPHKFQEGYKVFISTTDKYHVFVDNCGMTQSIAFIMCSSKEEAEKFVLILQHPLYTFINNICRWGNFNNIRILQRFPIPNTTGCLYEYFKITANEIDFINENI